jgi:uridine kinase
VEVSGAVADRVLALPRTDRRRVGVDGVDGAGKTVFGDHLAAELRARGSEVVRASVDGFHHPPQVRYRRGRGSPEGYFLDSYDYATMRSLLLDPLSPGGSGRFVRAVYDVHAERRVEAVGESAEPTAILVLDGIFLHRPELVGYWDLSVFLDVPFEVSVPRGAARGYGNPDPGHPSNQRYVEGQRLYLRACDPAAHADVVVDHRDLTRPRIR